MEKEKEKIEQLQKDIDELQKELDSTKRAERIECESLRRIQISYLYTLLERARSQLNQLQQKTQ